MGRRKQSKMLKLIKLILTTFAVYPALRARRQIQTYTRRCEAFISPKLLYSRVRRLYHNNKQCGAFVDFFVRNSFALSPGVVNDSGAIARAIQ